VSYSISALLSRNLDDVFGENDPARRRAAIDEIFTDDCVYAGTDFIVARDGRIAAVYLFFDQLP
jgi:hypothetical protein